MLQKLFYIGPQFRREHPQRPHYRLYRARVVARCQVRRVGALGPAVHARAGRLVCARHVSGRQRAIQLPHQALRPSVGIRLQRHRHNWVIDRWKPNELMDLYVEMGARYFMAMGAHHDNFDCLDSKYQPWNSVQCRPQGGYRRHLGKSRARSTDCVSASAFTTLRRAPGASSCRCVTPATRHGPKQGRALRRTANDSGRKRKMVGGHGSGGPLRAACHTQRRIRCIRRLPTSSCGGWMTPSPSIIPT